LNYTGYAVKKEVKNKQIKNKFLPKYKTFSLTARFDAPIWEKTDISMVF
jgi:hypothetical protein